MCASGGTCGSVLVIVSCEFDLCVICAPKVVYNNFNSRTFKTFVLIGVILLPSTQLIPSKLDSMARNLGLVFKTSILECVVYGYVYVVCVFVCICVYLCACICLYVCMYVSLETY